MQKEQRLHELVNMNILTCLINGLLKVYGDLLVSIMLYGSVAQGTQQEESDIDIAVLIKRGSTKEMKDNICDIIVDLELEYNEVLSVIHIDYDKFLEWENAMPFYKNLKSHGVILWQTS